MSSSNSNPYMQPGSEITKVDHNVSPAGLQARAAATQTEHAAPSGTTYTDPALYASGAAPSPAASRSPGYPAGQPESYMQPGSAINSIGSHISPAGAQARAAALQTEFSAPQGTVKTETFGEAPGAPQASPMGISPDVNIPSPIPAYARPSQQVEYQPVDALNTAREVFQPTSPNQPQQVSAEASTTQQQPQQQYQQQYQQQFAPPQYNQPPQQSYNAPTAQSEKPYTFTPQQPKQNFSYTYVPQQQQSGPAGQASPFNSASSVNPQTQTYSPQHSAAGSMARTAATQTSSSHPAGTRSATTSSPSYRTISELARGASYQPQTISTPSVSSTPNEAPKFSATAASPGMAARIAAQRGAHPAGTGPDAGVIGTPNFAAQNPSARVDVSQQYSPAGLAARAAAAGQAPAGTGAAFPKTRSAPQEVKYEAPARQINLAPEQQVSPAGMQARQLAYGKHPEGTGPGSVPGRSFSTMAGPARKASASAAMPRLNPAILRRKGGLAVGAAAAAGLLFSS